MLEFSKTHLTILSITFVFLVVCIVMNLKMRNVKENFKAMFNDEKKKPSTEISASNALNDNYAPILKKGEKIIGSTDKRCPTACSIKRQTIKELAQQGYLSEGKTERILNNIPGNCK